MFVRLTHLSISSEKKEELRRIYTEKVIPVVKNQKGNLGIRLLESTDNSEEFISVTEWESASDAEKYDSSGTYRSLVDLIKDSYIGKPVLKTYNVVESTVAASSN